MKQNTKSNSGVSKAILTKSWLFRPTKSNEIHVRSPYLEKRWGWFEEYMKEYKELVERRRHGKSEAGRI